MDLFTLYRILLPIAGLCLVWILFAIWAQRLNRYVTALQLVMWLGIIIMVLDLGWLAGYWLAEVERPIHITSPFNDQAVNLRQQVIGRYKEIPAGQALWVVVAPFRTPLYFPQPIPSILQPDGGWSSLTFVGSVGDSGRAFDIILVLVDQQGQQVFDHYLNKNDQSGLKGLPPGAAIVDKVTVWRR